MKAIYSILQVNYIRFLRYSFVGVLNTAIDIGVFTVLYVYLGVTPMAAHIAGFSLAVINSYAWNSRWTFKGKASPFRFFGVAVVVLCITSACFWILKAIIPVIAAKLAVTVVGVFCGYYANARFVFRNL